MGGGFSRAVCYGLDGDIKPRYTSRSQAGSPSARLPADPEPVGRAKGQDKSVKYPQGILEGSHKSASRIRQDIASQRRIHKAA